MNIFSAIEDNRYVEVERILRKHPTKVMASTTCGQLPLHFSLYNKASPDVINMLLVAYPQAANITDQDRCLPIHIALQKEASLDIIKMLVESYAEAVKIKNKDGDLPLHYALNWEASPDVIKMLFVAYPQAAKIADQDGCLPLHIAKDRDASADIITMLLNANRKATKVHKYDSGYLPLHFTKKKPLIMSSNYYLKHILRLQRNKMALEGLPSIWHYSIRPH